MKLVILLFLCTLCYGASFPDKHVTALSEKILYYENSSSTFMCKRSQAIWSINLKNITACQCPGKCGDILFNKTQMTAYCNGSSPILHFKQMKLGWYQIKCSTDGWVDVFVGKKSRKFYYEKTLAPVNNNYTLVCEKKMSQAVTFLNETNILMQPLSFLDTPTYIMNENFDMIDERSKTTFLMKNASLKDEGKIFSCRVNDHLSIIKLTANVKPSLTDVDINDSSGNILYYENSSPTFVCKNSHAIWVLGDMKITLCNCPGKCEDILFDKTRITAYCNGSNPVLHFKQMKIADNYNRLTCSDKHSQYLTLLVGKRRFNFYFEKFLAPVSNNYTLVCEKKMGQDAILYNDKKMIGIIYADNSIKNFDEENYFITSNQSKITLLIKNASLNDEGKIFGCIGEGNNLSLVILTADDWERIFIYIKASKVNRTRYVFTCYTNLSLKDITYEWHWNNSGVRISKGLSSSMVNGKLQGNLVFDMLNENESGNVSCHVIYRPFLSHIERKEIKMNFFPKVQLNATSETIKDQNPVNVSCYVQPPHDIITYRVFKVNGELVKANTISITKEANISCYATYDFYRGEIKTLKISMAIDLKASKDSRNRYVFTCYTNSSFQYITYEWYWNGVRISKGISSSMVDGKYQGSLVFDILNENESGNVTCHLQHGLNFSHTETKEIKMNVFPKVQLNATSETIKDQNPVNVSCYVQPPHDNIAYRVFKVNGELVKTNSVSITKEANISCYATYDFYRGEIKTLKISMAIGKKLCPKETSYNLEWPETVEGSRANVTCIGEFSGTASRLCLTNGIWELPNIECVKKSIVDARISLYQVEIGIGGDFEASVESLANETKESLNAEDIDETIKALDIATRITDKSEDVSTKDIKNLVGVFSNLLAKDSKPAWVKLEKKNNITAATIMKQMGDFGKVVSKKNNETTTITTENLVIELAKVNPFNNISFPIAEANQSKWVQESESNVFIPSDVLTDNFGVNEIVMMNAVLFRNMKELLPKNENTGSSINSFVLSISLQKPLENVTHKILLNFSHLSSGYSESSCNFWDFNLTSTDGGYWSTRGCEVVESNSKYTVCGCDHLTNFAILMNPVSHKSREILNIITIIGCSISIIALAVTIIVYVIFWKHVTSTDASKSQSVLLINMCVSLIIAYVIFVAFVEGPREKGVCTAIAALIQYFFLVVFFTMLAEGIDMAIALTLLFSARFQRLPLLLLLSWVIPVIIVAISLGSTMTKGFGNGKFCWLTLENNAVWSFIVPALIIILANIICVIFILKALLSTRRMLRENVRERLRTGARAVGILTPLLGFTWLFGVFAVNEDLVVFEYIFTISSSLQGFFIFMAYCVLNKQIQKNIYKKKKLGKQFTNKPSQSTSNSKDTKETDLTSFRKKSCKEETQGNSEEIVDTNNIHDSSL